MEYLLRGVGEGVGAGATGSRAARPVSRPSFLTRNSDYLRASRFSPG